MKEGNVKIIRHLFLIVLAIALLFSQRLSNTFAFIDDGAKTLDIYSNGNVEIIEFEGQEINGAPLRLQEDKGYNGMLISYRGEIIELSDNFTFNFDHHYGQSLSLNYDSYDDAFYLYRTFQYLDGHSIFKILAFLAMIVSILSIILLSFDLKNQSDHERDVFKLSLSRRTYQIIRQSIITSLVLCFFYQIFSDLLPSVHSFINNLSDQEFLFLLIALFFIIFFFTLIINFKTHNYKIVFDAKTVSVYRGNRLKFQENKNDIRTAETLHRNSNSLFYKKYQRLELILFLLDSNNAYVKVNLKAFGIDDYNQIANRFLTENDADIIAENDHIFSEKKQSFKLKGRRRTHPFFTALLLVFYVITIPLYFFWFTFSDALQSTNLFLLLVIPITSLIILSIIAFIQRDKFLFINVSRTSLTINDNRYSLIDVNKIYISRPHETGSKAKEITIISPFEKIEWQIKEPPVKTRFSKTNDTYFDLVNSLITIMPNAVEYI
ncbi:hypothetical protein ERUR111494_01640 [Erysipelothrix urinaevulpis]|uniref:hypothetical protein n=1 Tax=Erysipelothrix urinaevulpis TaxID=2683717 RepID=UPI00135AC8CD|nr:hypothetical protein [Erysipelothrix urinaevulpis]